MGAGARKWGRRHGAYALAIALFAVIPMGCGGDEDADDAEAALSTYVEALRDGDAAAACDHVAAATIEDLGSVESCERVFTTGFELSEERDSQIPDLEVGDVSVDGDTATATIESNGADQEVTLVREDGEWKLEGATALSQFHPDAPLG